MILILLLRESRKSFDGAGERRHSALDGQIVSAPDIESAIPGGQAQITYFDQSQASLLAQELNYGSLPVTLHEEDVVSVSPQPGFLHETTELDTLGIDRPETKCHLQ